MAERLTVDALIERLRGFSGDAYVHFWDNHGRDEVYVTKAEFMEAGESFGGEPFPASVELS